VDLAGRTKKFHIDRLIAIIEYFMSILLPKCEDIKNVNHGIDFYSCVIIILKPPQINSLAAEGLLKKSTTKGDELTSVHIKCNFDVNFVEKVAKNINFRLDEYLYSKDNNES